ncbi:cadherin domain-containing protein [Pseudomonas sp. CC6-YY-74]|uniref:beta strand repeat-containing protein n=1 Tax=Pseudomonas sp. CC6-YY-74 TaxID=1930532 RepID=UPI0009A14649|nr:cadherin domain-containing protein [Pseudomonas sp. CC6-YY-74]
MSQLRLRITSATQQVNEIPLDQVLFLEAQQGASYTIIDPATHKPVSGIVLKKRGDALEVEVDGKPVAQIDGFYAADQQAVFDVGMHSASGEAQLITSSTPTAEASDVVWQASAGEQSGATGWWSGLSPAAQLGIGAAGLGGVALAAGGGGGGGGGGGSGASAATSTVQGSVVAGPVIAGHGLSVVVYQADGVTELGRTAVSADGSFSLSVGSYTGVVIAKLLDADAGADYLDESTGLNKDLNAELFTAGVVSAANSTLNLNLNPLTTVAYHKALEAAGGNPLDASTVNASNSAIANAFGISDLQGTQVVTTNGGAYNAGDGLSAGEQYGAILAALSGADQNNGGNSQLTIDALVAGITLSGTSASLNAATQEAVIQGGNTAKVNTDGATSQMIDTHAPVFTSAANATAIDENSGAGQVVYIAAATDASAKTYSLKAGSDAGLSINASSGAVTLAGNPDFESKASYSFTVVATDVAGNASEQAVSLNINNLDEVAPSFTSGAVASALNENSGAGQVVYTATSTDNGDIATGSTVYSLKAGSDAGLSINASSGAVTLAGNPDFESKASYSFTVVASDAAGNASEQAVSLNINNLDEVAPSFTSGAVASALNENSGTGQVIYTATSTDSGDIATGSTVYSLKTGSDAGLSINASSGAVTLAGNPDFESKASYSFTVIATDAAGNASEQAVSLSINNLDEVAPSITSGAVASALNENSGAGQVIYTASSTDSGDIATGSTVYSLKAGSDAGLSINASSGAVTLAGDPDFESKASYSFTVVASDAAGNASEQAVSLSINNLDEVAPSITSGASAAALNENSGAGQVVYTATSTDNGDIATGSTVYSLKTGSDAGLSINASSGAVTLSGNPDFESKASYSFTVVATDVAGNASEQAVSLSINNLDEVAPSFTSGAVASALNENSGAGQVVYTATSTDNGDIATGSTVYSLKTGSDAGLSINASSGAVTLAGDPNFESKASYSFTVIASDAAGNASEQAVSLSINNLDEVAPSFTSGAVASALNENSGAGQVVYTATSTDSGDIATGSTVYSLKAGSDAGLSINASSGAVTLAGNPDFESKASYSFTVVATDVAGNASEQAVSLSINNLDEVAPSFTSGAVASALNENSGTGQVVYTATSTDSGDIATGSTVYSLKAGSDAGLSINASSGAVTLSGNPDFESKASYSFTVVATDVAGNASEQAVSLSINDLDEVAPSVSSLAISGATGAQNSRLNAGDVVNVTVTMNEATLVNTSGGTPRVALTIGGSTVYADYVSGSGSTALLFSYSIQAGETDANGIAIGIDALTLNGGILQDAAGNAASLSHGAVADNSSYLVDTTAPTLSSSSPADNATAVAVGSNIVLTFSEAVVAGSGDIVISDGVDDMRTISVTDATQVTISGNQVTINPSTDLAAGRAYDVTLASGVLTDAAGNAFAGVAPDALDFTTSPTNTAIVVFDLVEGVSSAHSGRTFQAGVSYTIYIRVNSNSGALSTDGDGPGLADSWGTWSGAAQLGADDLIVVAGTGSHIGGGGGPSSKWASPSFWTVYGGGAGFSQYKAGNVYYHAGAGGGGAVDLWNGSWSANPNAGRALAEIYRTAMPVGILTSQGLA